MSEKKPDKAFDNILDEIESVARDFRKQISQGKSPLIEKYITRVPQHGRGNLFSTLLAIEISFRRGQDETPNSSEYLIRFPQFKAQVRRAFFEPSLDSVDSSVNADGGGLLESYCSSIQDEDDLAPTCELADANLLGDYELIRELGRGAFGIVYEAEHKTRGNRVALKTLPAGSVGQEVSPDRLHRFRREFRSLSEINHPNLVGMQTLEVADGIWFFTMDRIDGEDFLSYVRPNNKLDEKRLRKALPQLVRGVLALHETRIIHRDLKPSNVLVDSTGQVVILDFGLVANLQKATDATATRSGTFAGTPRYAAPEQLFGERSESSDWYAIGTMVYEALVGEAPFGGTQMDVLRQKQEQDPEPLSNRPEYPQDLASLVDALVKRDQHLRPTTDAILEALQIDLETRVSGSTQGSESASASQGDDDLDDRPIDGEELELIGREAQLAELNAAKRQFLDRSETTVVWIVGKSGEGKSALVEKFLQSLRVDDEFFVLSGRCYDRESVPYKALDSQIDTLVRHLRSRSESEVDELLPKDVDVLADVFPVLRRVPSIASVKRIDRSSLTAQQLQSVAFAALRDLLKGISEKKPLVVYIDDLQWGDADSADVLANMFNSNDAPSLFLIGCLRRDEMELSPFLNHWNLRCRRDLNIQQQRINVVPLTETQCLAFLRSRIGAGAPISSEKATELYSSTKGSPYFLEQMIEGYDPETGTFDPVPLSRVIDVRLAKCPVQAQVLLEAVAVASGALPISELTAVAGLNSDVFATVTHMRSERLVRLIDDPGDQRVDTYHDKVRETVLQGIDKKRRVELHQAFADFIGQSIDFESDQSRERSELAGADRIYDFAHHLREAGDPRAFRFQLRAGRLSFENFAIDAALGYLEHALLLLPGDASRAEQFQLYFSLGRVLSSKQLLNEAIANFRKAIESSESRHEKARCKFLIGEAQCRQSEYSRAKNEFRSGFQLLGERNPRTDFGRMFSVCLSAVTIFLIPRWILKIWSRRSASDLELLAERHGAMFFLMNKIHPNSSVLVYHASRATALAKQSLNHHTKSEAYTYYATVLFLAGLRAVAAVMLKAGAKEYAQISGIGDAGVSSLNLATSYYINGDYPKFDEHMEKALPLLERSGHFQLSSAHHFLWHSWSVRGNCVELSYNAKKEVEICRGTGDIVVESWGKYGLAEGCAKQGLHQEGLRIAREALDTLEGHGSWTETIARVQKARVQVQNGDCEDAAKLARKAMSEVPWLRFNELTAPAFPLYVEARLGPSWLQADSKSNSLRGLSRAAMMARFCGRLFPNIRPHSLRVSGRLAAASRKPKKSKKYFSLAIKAAEAIGAKYELARSLIDKSQLDHADASNDREQGRLLLESLGCVLPNAEVEYLGIDREAHHTKASEARAKYAKEKGISEFDLATWDAEYGPIALEE